MAPKQLQQKKEDHKQASSRTKSVIRKTKRKPSYDRKAKHPDYVQFRCNVNAFNTIITEIKDGLNDRQKEILQKTPFWNLIEPFYNKRVDVQQMIKSDIDLVKLLKQFDHTTKSFKFGNKSFKITSDAVTQILGLPNEGKSVKLDNDRYNSTFRSRHFGNTKPSKARVEEQIHKAIALSQKTQKQQPKTKTNKNSNKRKSKQQIGEEEKEEDEEEVVDYDKDVVSLILVHLCLTLLFATSSSNLHWTFVEHCEKLDTLSSYSWARAVSRYINNSLVTKAKPKKEGKDFKGAVAGCTLLILFLLCEKTNIIQPIIGKENETPGIVKWSIVELHTRFRQINDLNQLEALFKTSKKRKTIREYEEEHEEKNEGEKEEGHEGVGQYDDDDDDDDESQQLKETRTKKRFEIKVEKEPVGIYDCMVKSMTARINHHQSQDPSWICPKNIQLWMKENNQDNKKKMLDLWESFIQAEIKSTKLEEELEKQKEALNDVEYVSATMTVGSIIQLEEIKNLKRRIAQLESRDPEIL